MAEIVGADASFQYCFDRALDFEAEGASGLTPVAMPRMITSLSLDNQKSDIRVMSKREVKISIVGMAIKGLLHPKVDDKGEEESKRAREQERTKTGRVPQVFSNNLV